MTHSAHMQVSKEMEPGKKNAFLVNPRITSAIQIEVNGSQAVALLDPCTKNGNLISNRFCQLYNIHTTETDNDSEDQCKDYVYDEIHYKDSDSDLEEGEIKEEEPDEQDLINL